MPPSKPSLAMSDAGALLVRTTDPPHGPATGPPAESVSSVTAGMSSLRISAPLRSTPSASAPGGGRTRSLD
eukprot:CAMPEP_0194291166 /NCGR_PEP_ID=MMETSP0169-20130528/42894_1 /TAXON_ID=218684 /ORGANISM="Corethron pennatum, Strain L29A3" /LENGTH=70 /DNA_ID=CAMNT_0039038969 /DNA_START=526 /DNA_END=735 /DNA_ORIENTATION=+